MHESKFDRRQILQGVLLSAVGAQVFALPQAKAAGLAPLQESDPTAKALGYHVNAKSVSVKDFPTFKPEQKCATCVQLQPGTGNERGCNLFAGKSVNVDGWCKVWVKKP